MLTAASLGAVGMNTLVGDVYFVGGTDKVDIDVRNSESAGTARDNTFNAFNDDLTITGAGTGTNTLVGDVYYEDGGDHVFIDVLNSGSAADDSTFSVFNDTMTGGQGDNHMVGDVYYDNVAGLTSDQHVDIGILNARQINDSGDNNTFTAFNDTMTSFDGTDVMVGDVYQVGGGNEVDIRVDNEQNGDNNVFDMFNDTLTSGDGNDTLIGDVWRDGGTNTGGVFAVEIGVVTAPLSDNNTFDMFNDTLNGGDLLVGDLYYTDFDGSADDLGIALGNFGGDNNTWTMFNDTLNGGAGDDDLWRDFLIDVNDAGGAGLALTLGGGLMLGTDGDNMLFNDTLNGGLGDDDYWGQLGDDILNGGLGDDIFHFGTTLAAGSTGGGAGTIFDGHDTIGDFSEGVVGNDDTIDLDALFDALGGFTDADYRADGVKITDTGADGVITIQDSSDTAVADFSITVLGDDFGGDGSFGQFTAAELAALGIDVGT